MPNKTIYIRDEHVPIYEKAESLGGENLSATIAEALRRYIAIEEAKAGGLEEIEIVVGAWYNQGVDNTRKVKFRGRKLAEGTRYTGQTSDRQDRGTDWSVYQTQAGKIVVRWKHWTRWEKESDMADYAILDYLPGYREAVRGRMFGDYEDEIPGDILAEAAKGLGQEMAEWVD